MAINTDINIRAKSDGAQAAFDALSKSVKNLSAASDEATKNSAALKAALADPANAGKSVTEIVKAMAGLDSNAKKAVGTVADLNKGVAALSDTTGTAAKQADELGGKFGKLGEKIASLSIEDRIRATRNWGLALGAAGAGGLILSNALVEAGRNFEENENLVTVSFGNQLEAAQKWSKGLQESLGLSAAEARKNAAVFNVMFKSMGLGEKQAFDMAKGLTELANDMASFYNLTPDQAFEKLRAGITGEAEPLKALGILIGEETVKQYAYAHGIAAAGDELTEQQKVLARYGAILSQTTAAQGDMKRSFDTAQAAARRQEVALKDAMASIGQGSKEAQRSIDEFSASLLRAANASPEIAKGAGYFQTYGSYAAAAAGSVVVFAATILQGADAIRGLGGMTAVWQAITNAIAVAQFRIGLWLISMQTAAASGIASLQALYASAATTAAGFTAATAAVTAIGVALAASVGWVAFAVGQHMGWIDKEQSYLERLAAGWYRLSDAILHTQSVAGASREQNEKDFAAELEKVKATNAKAVLKGTKTQAQADEDNRKAEIALHETWAREDLRIGDNANLIRHQEAAARLRQQAAPAAPAAITPAPAPSPAASISSAASALGSSSAAKSPAMNLSVEPGSDEEYEKDIEALEDRARDEIDKKRKKVLQDELRDLKRSFAARKKRAAAAKKAQADSLRALSIESEAAAAERTAELLESSAQLRGGAEIAGFRDKRQMSRDIRQINEQVKTGKLDKEGADTRIQALRDAYAARDAARQADLEEQIAQVDAQTALAEGAARAAGQTGALAQSTLRIAQARANRVVNVAAAKAQSLREEARSLAADAEDALRNTNNERTQQSSAAMREMAAALAAGRLRGSYDRTRQGGGVFGMRSGDYGDGPAFIGSNAGLMAAGIARAQASFRNRGVRGDGYAERNSGGDLRASVQSIVRDALGNLVIQFAPLKIHDDGGMDDLREMGLG